MFVTSQANKTFVTSIQQSPQMFRHRYLSIKDILWTANPDSQYFSNAIKKTLCTVDNLPAWR
ncbi:hypothetical protein LPB72_02190 [Hydrogenophaga crassostreae]|uniref:Uncharacterized protein n=1 Tax=Hydrogenophaga crassostreae TaxID=1763535 RepID=A0A162PCU3_9BURK|nr:hypothetical protein LPB072_02465 [Hydrogenophaga crassostreae]OAD43846.1 hypothetical protein LPB72_02190 [Hydrogenophaga crassostreae]